MPKVDKEKCIGCGTCVSMCSDCFKLDDEGKAESSCEGKSGCTTVDEVIAACPVDAISK
jgi:ferredoxin